MNLTSPAIRPQAAPWIFRERLPARYKIPSELVRTVPEARVKNWVAARELGSLHLSVVSVGELHKGFAIMPDGRRKAQLKDWLALELLPLFAGRVLPVTQAIAERWGLFDGQRQMMGRPLSAPDGMIAATASIRGSLRDVGWPASCCNIYP